MKDFLSITEKRDTVLFLESIVEEALFVYSPTSMKKIQFSNKNIVRKSTNVLTKNKEVLDNFIRGNTDKFKMVIGFGGGTATDIAKYIAYILNVELIIIPSMLSTNAYATNKVSLFVDNNKKTLEAKMADHIILDEQLIKKSTQQNLYGLADVFSIHTALKDWSIASTYNNEKIDEKVYNESKKLLDLTMKFVEENTLIKICDSIDKIYELVGISGKITNEYGTGRPESGSEHILAKLIEEKIKVPHGISVSVGIICMSIIQDNYSSNVYNCIKKLKVLSEMEEYDLTEDFIISVINEVEPRKDRFSIVNIYNKKDIDMNKILTTIRDIKNNTLIKNQKEKVVIIGLGYVGAPLAYLAAIKNFDVVGIDNSDAAIDNINKRLNIPSELSNEYVRKENIDLIASNDYSFISDADIIVICVPTPTKDNVPDLTILENVMEKISENIRKKSLIILESTVAPGMTKNYVEEYLSCNANIKVDVDYELAYCPERIDPGNKKLWVGNINRVCGASSEIALIKVYEFYNKLIDANIIKMESIEEAELVKVWENSIRNINIAEANLLAMICDKYNFSVKKVLEGLNSKVEQFGMTLAFPGIGPGGHCIPEDIHYLIETTENDTKINMNLFRESVTINENMPKYVYNKLLKRLECNNEKIEDLKILMLGISYKANSDDTRKSQALSLYHLIKDFDVVVYDPIAKSDIKNISSAKEFTENIEKANIVIISCAHDIFLDIDYSKYSNIRYIVDCWNKLDDIKIKSFGIDYIGVGI